MGPIVGARAGTTQTTTCNADLIEPINGDRVLRPVTQARATGTITID